MEITKYVDVSTNKVFRVSIAKFRRAFNFFSFGLKWTRETSHAGLYFKFEIWKYHFSTSVHDRRLWDPDRECYYIAGQSAR